MPAAAVIPAPIAYIKVVAVKKLVVGFLTYDHWPGALVVLCCWLVVVADRRAFAKPLAAVCVAAAILFSLHKSCVFMVLRFG